MATWRCQGTSPLPFQGHTHLLGQQPVSAAAMQSKDVSSWPALILYLQSHMLKTAHKPLDWWLHTSSKLSKRHWIQSSSMNINKTQDYTLPWLQQAKSNMDNNVSGLPAFVDVLHLIFLCSLLSSLVYNQAPFTWCIRRIFSTLKVRVPVFKEFSV